MVMSQVCSMNWNSPVAEDVQDFDPWIEAGFDPGGGQQIGEACSCRLRGLADRARDEPSRRR
jgi:hypothetical protein